MSRIHTPPTPWHPFVLAITLILAGSPSCSDDPTAPEEPADTQVSVESSNRETAIIGAAGGSVSATSNAGVTYTLDIPAGALAGDVEIAITPVTSIQNLPFAGRLEGAVRLGPSGLRLLVPGTLTIDQAPSTSGSEQLVGFSYEGDADSFEPAATIDDVSGMRVLVTHFSGAGAASSEDPEDWLATLCASVPTLDYPFAAQMDHCWTSADVKREYFFRVARDYLEDMVTPIVQGGGDLSAGVAEYIEWYQGCDELAAQFDATDWEDVLATEIETIQDLVQTELVASVAGEKTALCSQGGVEHLRLLFEYRHLAIAAGFEETTGLRDEDILEDLCAEIRIPEITLVDPMPMNQGTSLDARAELWINDQREGAVFNFRVVTVHGTSTCAGGLDFCEGRSNGLGEYTVVVTRTASGLVEIDVTAALVMSLFVTSPSGPGYSLVEAPLRRTTTVLRESYSIAATFPGTVEPEIPVALSVVVTRDNPGGSPQPIEGATVTFTVDDGTADPLVGVTDASGALQTLVTADQGESRLTVRIDASLSGVLIASRTVEATVQSPATGIAVLTSRMSYVYAGTPDFDGCPANQYADSIRTDLGLALLAVSRLTSCSSPNGNGNGSASVNQSSDTDFASDGSSAEISCQGSGAVSSQSDGTFNWECAAVSLMEANFEIENAPMNFQLDASFDGTIGEVTVRLQQGTTEYTWHKFAGDTQPSTFALTGTLPPGSCLLSISVVGNAGTRGEESTNGTFSGAASLLLSQTPTAAFRDQWPPSVAKD